MRERRNGALQRCAHLDLRAGVGHVVFAADHMRDAEGDVVDHRGEAVKVGAVGAYQNRIALARLVDVLGPAH